MRIFRGGYLLPNGVVLGVDLSGSHIHSYQFQSASDATEIQELAGTFADEAAEGSGALPNGKQDSIYSGSLGAGKWRCHHFESVVD